MVKCREITTQNTVILPTSFSPAQKGPCQEKRGGRSLAAASWNFPLHPELPRDVIVSRMLGLYLLWDHQIHTHAQERGHFYTLAVGSLIPAWRKAVNFISSGSQWCFAELEAPQSLPVTATPHPPARCGRRPSCRRTRAGWWARGSPVAPLEKTPRKHKITLTVKCFTEKQTLTF